MTAEMKAKTRSTVDPEEVERFSRIANEWWDERGKFAPLHRINPLRIGYIKEQVERAGIVLEGATLLDIGCGGGLISEPLSRLGANVTGVDASEKNIAVATLHAQQTGATPTYRATTAEALVDEGAQFDVVLALEIVEHVADVEAFVACVCKLVRPGGLIIMSTLNRTVKSYALAIVGAEYVLRWLPIGTHTWNKFLRPSELHHALENGGARVHHMTGMVMNPLSFKWRLDERDLDVNYLISATKDPA
jgi:2-polyprenyl-6-hydroxyphenyl methylase / 3-demethylubiquinone-9 3-methyltransferase